VEPLAVLTSGDGSDKTHLRSRRRHVSQWANPIAASGYLR
jgi:hypothetical protein